MPKKTKFSLEDEDLIPSVQISEIISKLGHLGNLCSALSAEEVIQIGEEYCYLAMSFFELEYRDVRLRNPDVIVKDVTVAGQYKDLKRPTHITSRYPPNEDIVKFYESLLETFISLKTIFLENSRNFSYDEAIDYKSIGQLLRENLKRAGEKLLANSSSLPNQVEERRKVSYDPSRRRRHPKTYRSRRNANRLGYSFRKRKKKSKK
jgi:hypothetical protein